MPVQGVLTGSTGFWARVRGCVLHAIGRQPTRRGYCVDGGAALTVLDAASPEAAAWWRQNAPYYVQSGRRLVFAEEACEVVEGDAELGAPE